jgi:transposase
MTEMEVPLVTFALKSQWFSIRSIAAKLGVQRKTEAKYFKASLLSQCPTRRSWDTNPVLTHDNQAIHHHIGKPKDQIIWSFVRPKRIRYRGGYTLDHYVRNFKECLRCLTHIPFESPPGLQAQMELGHFLFREYTGPTTTLHFLIFDLRFFRAVFADFVKRCIRKTFPNHHIYVRPS